MDMVMVVEGPDELVIGQMQIISGARNITSHGLHEIG